MAALAFNPDLAAVLADDAVDDGKAEPCARADRLGGEKRIENSRDRFGRNARSVVGNLQSQFVFGNAARADADASVGAPSLKFLLGLLLVALIERLLRVDHEIQHDLQHLARIGQDRGQARIEIELGARPSG